MQKSKLTVGFILSRSFTLSAFALFVDTLRLASDVLDKSGRVYADWEVLANMRNPIISSCGVEVTPTSRFTDPTKFNYIVVVGGLLRVAEPVDAATIDYLKQADNARIPLIGICTGTFILAEAGLLHDHSTCVSWLHFAEFQMRFPDQQARPDRLFHLDRRRGSCVGGSGVVDMAATIVRRHINARAERNALNFLQIDRTRPASHVQVGSPPLYGGTDQRIKAALIFMESYTEHAVSISRLAAEIGLSRRQLERLFHTKLHSSPAAVYRILRLERAKRLVLETQASMLEIAIETGFDNPSHFSRSFREYFGYPPSSLRLQLESVE
ncbi:GlxA family transcriptional regulator [Mesorhizobium sp. C416B]|uniref:GlxA family transcriptional regulator n=1 Tax=unclassified Mesorhizobium TaxID=325217 RepID=UPI0003CDD0B2|nr:MULTISPECIES: GlxA family transcriptional regulator [unclassified Mesorhizobium]ESX41202.1 AraC family transcriptional regulator [Mesorhizobium sp. LSHC426A00]ESX48474.1 AraC family transcriptional regulator [Mesorhizobium sp. LSHC424B00]ESX56926.1 AraC family transcriptional regulator [Mesorhizobium sp. LSHC422A00]ESX65371.1 AraC family transcriptional regulator [Mesorhizobium sp. LSHC416B00]WJI65535.1 GlxA family transcriptional regulator [Mesorhizobium sp. C416B]